MNQKVESLSFWWGEAPDEPAREDARPTDRFMTLMRVQCWRLRLPMNRTPSPHPSPPLGERVPEGRVRGILSGSWSQCAVAEPWRLSMNLNVLPASCRRKKLGFADETSAARYRGEPSLCEGS
jgi:hypothetical protein